MASYAQSSAPPVSVSASKGAAKKPGTLRSLNIRIVENGYVGSCSFEPKRSKKDGYPMYEPDKEYALADRAALNKFLDDVLDTDGSESKK